jgi:hypothetical protein
MLEVDSIHDLIAANEGLLHVPDLVFNWGERTSTERRPHLHPNASDAGGALCRDSPTMIAQPRKLEHAAEQIHSAKMRKP